MRPKLSKKRCELDRSQEYMALELNISQKPYSDIETGQTRLKNEMLYKIANILKIKSSEIFPISGSCASDQDIINKHNKLITYLIDRHINFQDELR